MANKKAKSSFSWSELGAVSFGAAVGGVLGMLFSPNSGRKNRAVLAKEGKKLVKTATKAVQQAEKAAESSKAKVASAVKKAAPKVKAKAKKK